jgi:hypothetical protein
MTSVFALAIALFLLVNLVWIVLPAYAAVPLMFTVPGIDVAKAYFEAMSALTATGATAPAKPVVTAAAKPAPAIARPATGSAIQTTDLPPSRATGTVIPTLPSSPNSSAASAGVDFATMGTPSASTQPMRPSGPTTASSMCV